MVFGTALTLPAQLAASSKQPVDKILRDLAATAPLPTRHSQKGGTNRAAHGPGTADLVNVRKGGQLQPMAQPYRSPYQVLEKGPSSSAWTSTARTRRLW